jgi:uncharacterized protein YjbI with pentapeptide repeats
MLIAFRVVCLAYAAAHAFGETQPCTVPKEPQEEWTWKDSGGNNHKRDELVQVLHQHELWLRSNHQKGSRADLSGTDLDGADLTGANLEWADLSQASLGGAEMRRADLNNSILKGATLSYADLTDATLKSADLIGISLNFAILCNADLTSANLTSAQLQNATLRNANLTGARLDQANLKRADMMDVRFESESLPELRGIAAATNLESLRYEENPDRLVDLARRFKEEGFREQEEKVVYARRRTQTGLFLRGCRVFSGDLSACAQYGFNRVLVDFTCRYGMSPLRPLKLVIWLWSMCSFVYFLVVHLKGESALYRLDTPDLPAAPESTYRRKRVRPLPVRPWRGTEFLLLEFRLFWTAMFFSAMCASSLSLRNADVGPWIRLLSRHEFEIKAVGWVRIVAGCQSIVSVGLIALSVVTYFAPLFR